MQAGSFCDAAATACFECTLMAPCSSKAQCPMHPSLQAHVSRLVVVGLVGAVSLRCTAILGRAPPCVARVALPHIAQPEQSPAPLVSKISN